MEFGNELHRHPNEFNGAAVKKIASLKDSNQDI